MTFKKFLVVIAFITPLIFLFVLSQKHKNVTNEPSQAAWTRYKPLFDKWRGQAFTKIQDSEEFRAKLESVKISDGKNLTSDQERDLRESIYRFVMSYHIGTFEAFLAFRAPVTNYTVAPYVRQFLEERHKALPSDLESQIRLFWETIDKKGKWLGFWTGLALESANIDISTTDTVTDDLGQHVLTQENVGLLTSGPMITFNITPADIIKGKSSVTYATVKIIMENKDIIYPVYCRLYWCEEYKTWLPCAFATAYSGPTAFSLKF